MWCLIVCGCGCGSRFAYDGLKTQRLTAPMAKDSAGKLQQCSWEDALTAAGRQVRLFVYSSCSC